MEQNIITLRGNVGTEPMIKKTEKGVPYGKFRVGISKGRWDDRGLWQKDEPRWYTVRVWDQLATNVFRSIEVGDPVIVVGRPRAEAWVNEDGKLCTALTMTAIAVGHDLAKGIGDFKKLNGKSLPNAAERELATEGNDIAGGEGADADAVADEVAATVFPSALPSNDGLSPQPAEHDGDGADAGTVLGQGAAVEVF